jgi:phosphoribosylaminoimidazolecarboxamide formyltransferase/IMP cyclohydrolase
MSDTKKITNALISVFYKDGLEPVVRELHRLGVIIYSTGGTQEFIEKLGIPVIAVESLTGYPSILGGRVKTLHPKVFGGILARRENPSDISEAAQFEIPMLDLVIVDLYPFEETVKSTTDESAIIEKIDIGGVSLIRAAAKKITATPLLLRTRMTTHFCSTCCKTKKMAVAWTIEENWPAEHLNVTSHYDTHIFNYFNGDRTDSF